MNKALSSKALLKKQVADAKENYSLNRIASKSISQIAVPVQIAVCNWAFICSKYLIQSAL